MRTLHTDMIAAAVSMLIERTSFALPDHTLEIFTALRDAEENERAKSTMDVLLKNADIAALEHLPLCQDCGSTIVFAEIGQDVHLEGMPLSDAIHEGIRAAYEKYSLRKSIVADPLRRVNTNTNTPGFIHIDIVSGENVALTVYLKGGGSENASNLKMFNPTASEEEIIAYIVDAVMQAGPNPCPPIFLGVGIGGTADVALLNAKKAVLRGAGTRHADLYYARLEDELLRRINNTRIGPLGWGGRSTAAGVFIKEAACHIASLPVALNMNCHSLRYAKEVL
jgi:fumarate hydratase subunit alpha